MKRRLASFEVALKSKERIAEGTMAFTFEKPEGFQFKAGQHIRMTLINPPETDAEGDKRFLTMASTPQEPDLTFAMRMRDTAFKRVLGRMQPGEKVLIQKLLGESPHGTFVLHEDATKPAVFIIGGIGIVAAYSMIKDATERKLPHKLFLFYSNRRPEDAPYLAKLQKLAKQNPRFTLIATMTEPEKSTQKWAGETGQINQIMLEKHVPNIQTPIYYAAGLPEMVSAMKKLLVEVGVNEADIRAEEFTGFDLNKLRADNDSKRKNYLLFAAIGLVVLVMIIAYVGDVSHMGLLSTFSTTNPISYLIVAALLALVAFKIYAILKIRRVLRTKRDNEKLTASDILKSHMPAKRGK